MWLVEVKREGFHRRRYLRQSAHRKCDAKRVEQELIREYEALKEGGMRCKNSETGGFTGGPVGFSDFAQEYLSLLDAETSNFKNKKRHVEKHLAPFFGATPLGDISVKMVDRLRKKLRTEKTRRGHGRKRKTVNNIMVTLNRILDKAVEYQFIEQRPRVHMEKTPVPEIEWLEDDVERFVEAVPREWLPLVVTALLTGLRRGELYELRWGDMFLDCEQPYIRVSRSVVVGTRVDTYKVKPPKSKKGRFVPIKSELLTVLRAIKTSAVARQTLVFQEKKGGYLQPSRLYRVVRRAGEAIGRKVHPHMLRHTFASLATEQAVPPRVLQQWMGHARFETTERYTHLRPLSGGDLIERLPQLQIGKEEAWQPTDR